MPSLGGDTFEGATSRTYHLTQMMKSVSALQLYELMMCSTPLINIGKPRVVRKTKGIISDPMPTTWYTSNDLNINEDDTPEQIAEKEFNLRILANKKPYFMNYIYPEQKKQYDTYVK